MEKIIRIGGSEEDVDTLIEALCHIEYLGNIGASRNIVIRVDGDGSGRMHFTDELGDRLSDKKYNIKQEAHAVVGVYDIG